MIIHAAHLIHILPLFVRLVKKYKIVVPPCAGLASKKGAIRRREGSGVKYPIFVI